jgi:hypothetical protein
MGAIDFMRAYRELKGLRNPVRNVAKSADDGAKSETVSDSGANETWPEVLEWEAAVTAAGFEKPAPVAVAAKIPNSEYENYITNCGPDAFRMGTTTFNARLATYGEGDPRLKRWYEAQLKVFEACSGHGEPPSLPEPGWGELEWQDRMYQRAAVLMYVLKHEEAVEAFTTIAADEDSPWRELSSYLKLRVLMRQATLDDTFLVSAREQIARAISNQEVKQYNNAAANLLVRLGNPDGEGPAAPDEVRKTLAEQLVTASESELSDDSFKQFLRITRFYWNWSHTVPVDEIPSGASDLERWISVLRCKDNTPDQSACYAVAKSGYEADDSLPWLFAFALRIKAGDPLQSKVEEALENVNNDSAGYPTAQLALARIALASGDEAKARARINALKGLQLHWSAPLKEVEFLAAQEAKERATLAAHLLSLEGENVSGDEGWVIDSTLGDPVISYFTPTRAIRRLNLFSVQELAEISLQLPADDATGSLVLSMAFTRAMIDQERAAIEALFPRVLEQAHRVRCSKAIQDSDTPSAGVEAKLRCELLGKLQTSYMSLPVAERRLGELLVLALLSNAKPYITRSEGPLPCGPLWWCSATRALTDDDAYLKDRETLRLYEVPSEILNRYGKLSGGVWLGEQALEAVKTVPRSELAPAILNRVIWGTRSACADPVRSALMKKAFDLLHSEYRESKFAKVTPFWFP